MLFLVIYDLLHKKDTFFSLNRIYLISTSILSLILPFIKIKGIQKAIPQEYIFNLPAVFIGQETQYKSIKTITPTSIPIENINYWLLIYFIGIGITLIFFFKNNRRLYRLRKHAIHNKIDNFTLITLHNSKSAFSFWNTIYLGDLIKKEEREQIILHEMVHLQEKHSIDLLWFELLKIIFWFNPLVYIYQSKVNILHEFIADSKSADVLGKRKYYEQLLNTAFNTEKINFINQFFNHSLLKKRIMMLQKSKSATSAKYKYLTLVPILLLMITFSSFSEKEIVDSTTNIVDKSLEEKKDIKLPKEEITQTKIDSAKKGVPFAKIDKVPVMQNCKNITDKTEIKKCVSNEIKAFVNTNFNITEMEKYALPGINRIYVRFKIDKTGIVTDVQTRGPAAALEIEAKRVVSSLPQMIPGEHNGEKVSVLYSLPIVFNVTNNSDTEKKQYKNDISETTILSEDLSQYKNHNIKSGYYLITNIFKHKNYLQEGLKRLKDKGFSPNFFKNPKDGYFYTYLERHDQIDQAKKALLGNMSGRYDENIYIINVNAE
ncbi:M56 family metallopeptidase [Aquimarina sp. AU119]|uniref:M56 family metallopeptidase n=1 Tax=Aquimarina sp. AU119 TaxID=2108528 RepID=UPI00135B4790|nr:M56 family metallopeptidase [Aquimarina sp. AU119]